jgi:hypothetical protein
MRQEEKNFVIANYDIAAGQETIPAEEIAQEPRDKQLGFSSQQLRVEDFELMKTLGTGTLDPRAQPGTEPVTGHTVDKAICRHLRARLVGASGKP